jgi:uncharacterized membrane protein YagU involved in acid resistance
VHIFDAKCNRELFMSPVVLEVFFSICYNLIYVLIAQILTGEEATKTYIKL